MTNDLEFIKLHFSLGRYLVGLDANFKISKGGQSIDPIPELINATNDDSLVEDDGQLDYGVAEKIPIPKITGLTLRCHSAGTEYVTATDCNRVTNNQEILTKSDGSLINVTIDFKDSFNPIKFRIDKTGDEIYVLYAEYEEDYVLKTLINDPSGNSVDNVEFLNADGSVKYTGNANDVTKALGTSEVIPTEIICLPDIAERSSYNTTNSECDDMSRSGSGISITIGNDGERVISSDPRDTVSNVKYYAIGDKIYVTYDFDCVLQLLLDFDNIEINGTQNTDCSEATVDIGYFLEGNEITNTSFIDDNVVHSKTGGTFATGTNKFVDNTYSLTIKYQPNIFHNGHQTALAISGSAQVSMGVELDYFKVRFLTQTKNSAGSPTSELNLIEEKWFPFPTTWTANPTLTTLLKDGTTYTGDASNFIEISRSTTDVDKDGDTRKGRHVNITIVQNERVSGNGIVTGTLRNTTSIAAQVDVSREYEFQMSGNTLNIPIRYTYESVERAALIVLNKEGNSDTSSSLQNDRDSKIFIDTTDFSDPFKRSGDLTVGDINNPGEVILSQELWNSGIKLSMTQGFSTSSDGCGNFYVCLYLLLPKYATYTVTNQVDIGELKDKATGRILENMYFEYDYNIDLIASALFKGTRTNATLNFEERSTDTLFSRYKFPADLINSLPDTPLGLSIATLNLNGVVSSKHDIYSGEVIPNPSQSRRVPNLETAFGEDQLKIVYDVHVLANDEKLVGATLTGISFVQQSEIFTPQGKVRLAINLENPEISDPIGIAVYEDQVNRTLSEDRIKGSLVGVEVQLRYLVDGSVETCRSPIEEVRKDEGENTFKTCIANHTQSDIFLHDTYEADELEYLEFRGRSDPSTYIMDREGITTEVFDYDENNAYDPDGLRIIIPYDKVFYTEFEMFEEDADGAINKVESETLKSFSTDGEPTLHIRDIRVVRDGKDITDIYGSYIRTEESESNTIASGTNSASAKYILNSTIILASDNLDYQRYALDEQDGVLNLTIFISSSVDTAGWIPYIKLIEDRPTSISDNLKRRAGIFSRDDYGVNYLLEANIQSFSGVDARKDTQYALWTLSENYIMFRQNERGMIEPDSNVNLTRLVRIENSLNDWNTLETGFHDNRTLAFMFQDENVIDVLARSNQKDAVIVIPVVDDSRRREVNAIPCPLSYLDRCQSLDREDRVVFIQGITNSSQVSYNLNVTDSNGKIYYKYSRSGCGGMNNCLTIPVDWTSTLKPSNGVAAAYYQHLLIVMSKALHLTIPEAHKLLMNLAEPISDEDSKRDFGKSIISFERLIDEVTLEPISRDRILSIINN